MAETTTNTTPRLMAAAKEFNIGKDTLVDFLVSKGFSSDDLKPTSKLSEDMYRVAQAEFAQDKAARARAEKVDLGKTPATETVRKRKDEEDLSIKKKAEPVKKAEEAQPVETVQAATTTEAAETTQPSITTETPVVEVPATTPQQPVSEPTIETTAIVETPTQTTATEEVSAEPKTTPTTTENQPESTKIEAPIIEGPKVIAKIDLDALKPKTKETKAKPSGTSLSKTAAITSTPKTTGTSKTDGTKGSDVSVKPTTTPPAATNEPKPTQPTVAQPPIIENIQREKLTGPKILGKIDLPVSPTENKNNQRTDKRERKRIPINKKPETNTYRPQGSGDNANRGGAGTNQSQQGRPRFGNQQRPDQNRLGNRGGFKREDKVIDAKEIQEKLKATQAKLNHATGGNKGKATKAKLRKARKEELELQGDGSNQSTKIQVTEFVTVSDLAGLMDVSFADIISKVMSLGIMVSINQRLDADIIELVASEFGYEVEFMGVEDITEVDDEDEDDDDSLQQERPPIVTIMGHVDHGKTSLLDYIRNTNVIAGEAGGITQHIGAYEVTTEEGKKITFLDTPGHEAFTAMRARGAKVTDIAVIVIAADDAVMPQTKEAISHAQAANVPMIFAINKMDREGANPEKIKEQLAAMNILVEDWGGTYQSQEISAKKGVNVNLLLEKILLQADMLELKANPDKQATGSIIEASLDKGRGYVATILVQNGTLRQGDMLVSGQFYGKIKAMYNERSQKIQKAPPSTPVQILGLNGAPQAGELFKVFEDEAEARELATRRGQLLREQGIRARRHITLEEIGRRLALGNFKELNIIIKGDVDGSVEALSDSLQKLSTEEVVVKVIHKAVGAITESDVTLANASDAIIIGFNVRPSVQSAKLAEQEGIEIKMYSVIYKAIEDVKSAMEGLLEPTVEEKILGNIEIREVYKFDKATVAGCYVLDGKVQRNNRIRLVREGIVIFTGELGSLKRYKEDVKEVTAHMECGLTIKNYNDLKVNDIVEAFEEVEVKRSL